MMTICMPSLTLSTVKCVPMQYICDLLPIVHRYTYPQPANPVDMQTAKLSQLAAFVRRTAHPAACSTRRVSTRTERIIQTSETTLNSRQGRSCLPCLIMGYINIWATRLYILVRVWVDIVDNSACTRKSQGPPQQHELRCARGWLRGWSCSIV